MRDILKEPIFKRSFVILSVILSIISVIFITTQYVMLNQIHEKQIILNQNIVGRLYSLDPKHELEIVKAVLLDGDKADYEKGRDILKKYGYDTNIKALSDDSFKDYYFRLISYDFLCWILILGFNALVLIRVSKYYVTHMEELSVCIEKVLAGDFSDNNMEIREGVLARIECQFHRMNKIIVNNMENMKREKENIKALVADISHQLKTPIASIKIFNSLLSEDEISEDERAEFLNRSKENIDRLEWLAASLVKISRLEAGLIEIKKSKQDIKNTIVEAVNQIYLKAMEKGIDINLDSLEGYEFAYDEKWTREAIFNVIENAVKYTPHNGKITISILKLQYYIRVDIKDNGIGIEEGEVNNIFKRFYRGKDERIENKEGSGIGLYLTRRILEKQGGSITVSSEKEKGSVFNLFLQKC